jgi:hypothetical protein
MNPDNLIVIIEQPEYQFTVSVNQSDVSIVSQDYTVETPVYNYTIDNTQVLFPVTVNNTIWQIRPSEVITMGSGTEFPIHIGNTPPANPEIGDLWLDTN